MSHQLGGPGGGTDPKDRTFFNPAKYQVNTLSDIPTSTVLILRSTQDRSVRSARSGEIYPVWLYLYQKRTFTITFPTELPSSRIIQLGISSKILKGFVNISVSTSGMFSGVLGYVNVAVHYYAHVNLLILGFHAIAGIRPSKLLPSGLLRTVVIQTNSNSTTLIES